MSKSKRWFVLSLNMSLILFLGGIQQTFAQESLAEEFTLEEITVTAQKRVENQQKVAIPMDVISGEELAETGKMNVDDILSNLTNVVINYSGDGMRIGMRGLTNTDGMFGSGNTITVSNPVVAVNIDGAYDRQSSGSNLFDVERIEVLYGPQSTMYASNSPGGIVNVVTAAPKTDKYAASVSLEAGNYGLFTGQAMVNAPIVTDKFAVRLAVQKQKRDAYLSGADLQGEDTTSARLKTLYQPTDKFSLTVTGLWSKSANAGFFANSVQAFDTQDGHWYTSPPGPPGQPLAKDGAVTNPWTAYTSSGFNTNANFGADRITNGINGEIKWDTGIASLSVIPSYSESHANDKSARSQTMGPTTIYYNEFTKTKSTQKGFEARMDSPEDSAFKWIVGVNIYKSDSHTLAWTDNPAVVEMSPYFDVSDDNKAAFGNITYPITDTFRGTAGIRFSSAKAQSVGGLFGSSNAPEYHSPDYKLGVEYDVASNSMLYATFATSYRVNAFRTGIPPEKAKTYTVGAKNRFLNNKLQVNASAYFYDYLNVQVQASGLSSSTGIYEDQVVDNEGNPVDLNSDGNIDHTLIISTGGPGGYEDPWSQFQHGEFHTIGLDLSTDWIITSMDKMSLSVSYLDSKWKNCKINAYLKQLDSTGNVIPFWAGDGLDYNGMTRTFSPKWTTNLGYEHNFELGSFGTLVPHVDLLYKTHYVLSFLPSEFPVNYQASYYTVDGNMTFTHSSGVWSLNAYIKNATDYAAKTMYQGGSMSITDPRTYGAVLSVKF
jgi:iron complex outermembrane recepter protein